MEDLKLQHGQEVRINIPFTYTIGETGYYSGIVLETIEDCKHEVGAELNNGFLENVEIMMEAKIKDTFE